MLIHFVGIKRAQARSSNTRRASFHRTMAEINLFSITFPNLIIIYQKKVNRF